MEIVVSLPEADFMAYTSKALEEIAKDVELQGFRKGAKELRMKLMETKSAKEVESVIGKFRKNN